jgi:hypothetical protein
MKYYAYPVWRMWWQENRAKLLIDVSQSIKLKFDSKL